jgi:hypothetical protein
MECRIGRGVAMFGSAEYTAMTDAMDHLVARALASIQHRMSSRLLNGTIRRFVGRERPQAAKCGVNVTDFGPGQREFSGLSSRWELVVKRCGHVLRSHARAIIF